MHDDKYAESWDEAALTEARAWPIAASTMLAVRLRHVMVLGTLERSDDVAPSLS